MSSYQAFIEEVVKSVVEYPDDVKVTEEAQENGKLFLISCHQGDVGKVIGKSGRVIASIRNVVGAIASKQRERAFVKVVTQDE